MRIFVIHGMFFYLPPPHKGKVILKDALAKSIKFSNAHRELSGFTGT